MLNSFFICSRFVKIKLMIKIECPNCGSYLDIVVTATINEMATIIFKPTEDAPIIEPEEIFYSYPTIHYAECKHCGFVKEIGVFIEEEFDYMSFAHTIQQIVTKYISEEQTNQE